MSEVVPTATGGTSDTKQSRPSGALPVGTTPVPNALFDTILPHLSDTELRVILVVTRATLGWKAGTGRKPCDWLSHRQLQARTGRAGASVSHAVEGLVRRGLLIVQDGAGRLRDSASSRRAARGRLYYRLSEALLAPPQKSGNGFETPEKRETSNISTSTTRLQKAKTTKETGTKENQKQDAQMLSLESEVHSWQNPTEMKPGEAGELSPTTDLQKDELSKNEILDSGLFEGKNDLEEQVERFKTVFAQAYGLARPGEPVPPVEEEDQLLLRKYLRFPGFSTLEIWLNPFFDSSFGYARRRDWSLGCYLNCLFILQAQAGANPSGANLSGVNPHSRDQLQRDTG